MGRFLSTKELSMSSTEEKQLMNRVLELNKSICSLIELLGGRGIPIVLDPASQQQQTNGPGAIQSNVDNEQQADQEKTSELTVENTIAEYSGEEITDIEKVTSKQAANETASVTDLEVEDSIQTDGSVEISVEQSSSQIEQEHDVNKKSEDGTGLQNTNEILVIKDDQDNLGEEDQDNLDEEKPGDEVNLHVQQESESEKQLESPEEDHQTQVFEVIPSQETLTRKLEQIDENNDGKLDFEKVAKETFDSLPATKITEDTFIDAMKYYAEHWQMKTCDGNVSKEDFLAFWQKFSDLFDEIDQNKDQTIVVIEITNFLKEQARKHNLKKAEENIMIYVNQIFKDLDTETDTALNVLEFMMGYPIFLKVLDDYKRQQ